MVYSLPVTPVNRKHSQWYGSGVMRIHVRARESLVWGPSLPGGAVTIPCGTVRFGGNSCRGASTANPDRAAGTSGRKAAIQRDGWRPEERGRRCLHREVQPVRALRPLSRASARNAVQTWNGPHRIRKRHDTTIASAAGAADFLRSSEPGIARRPSSQFRMSPHRRRP